MKRLLSGFLLFFFAVACNGVVPASPTNRSPGQTAVLATSTPTADPPASTPTFASFTSTESATPTIPPSSTPASIPCDPLESYCIETGHFFLDRPIALPGTITIDRGFPYGGTQFGARDPHHGVEFYNASGTPVLAAAGGLVVVAGNDSQNIYGLRTNSYGNIIIIEHHFPGMDQPVYTVYGHLSLVEVHVGSTVLSGDEIGKVGATGAAIGSHLHFEVRQGRNDYDSNRNPVLWLKPLTGDAGVSLGALAGRLQDTQGNLIHTTTMDFQYFPDLNGPQAMAWQVETYAPEDHPVHGDDAWNENFAMSDLPAGDYRISLISGGRLYEHWIVVAPGRVTFFVLQIDQ